MAKAAHDLVSVNAPTTRDEIRGELLRVIGACDVFWNHFSIEEFLAPLGPAWSPADNVRHLVKSAWPVALALRLPRLAVRALFGRSPRPSRSFGQLRADYQAVLAAGGRAGRFAPRPLALPADAASWREALMGRRARVHADLRAQAGRWSEGDLEACRLPHPLLGRLTAREMLLFTLYHEVHHATNVARRYGPLLGTPTSS